MNRDEPGLRGKTWFSTNHQRTQGKRLSPLCIAPSHPADGDGHPPTGWHWATGCYSQTLGGQARVHASGVLVGRVALVALLSHMALHEGGTDMALCAGDSTDTSKNTLEQLQTHAPPGRDGASSVRSS